MHLGLLLTFCPVLRNVTMLSYNITIVSFNNIMLQSVVSKNVPIKVETIILEASLGKYYAPINVKLQGGVGGGGGEVEHGVGILTFSFKKIQIPHPRDKIIGQNPHPAASEGGKMSFVPPKSLAWGRHIRSKSLPCGQTSRSNSRG